MITRRSHLAPPSHIRVSDDSTEVSAHAPSGDGASGPQGHLGACIGYVIDEYIDAYDIPAAFEDFCNATRIDLLRELNAKFCDRCGGFSPAGLGCECDIGRTPMLPNGRPAFAVV